MTQTRKSFQDRSNRNTAACGVLHSQPLESFPNTLSNCLHLWSPWDVMEQSDRDQQGTSTERQHFTRKCQICKEKKSFYCQQNNANSFAIATLFDRNNCKSPAENNTHLTFAGCVPLFAVGYTTPMNAHRDTWGPQALRAAAALQAAYGQCGKIVENHKNKNLDSS